MLYRLGLALELLDLGVGHTVLDFGSGSCWLSYALNQLGCRTISVDVSPTAIELGREMFRRGRAARNDLEPRFLVYDGRRIPLEEACVDRAICFDAFHHVPNPHEILHEMFRVLRPGGRLVMAEPGAGHAHSHAAIFETDHYGVLESDLVLEDLLAQARAAGFSAFELKPYPEVDNLTLDETAHLELLAGDHSIFPLAHVVASMRELHVLAMSKAGSRKDSRNPGRLTAAIDTDGVRSIRGHAGKEVPLLVTVTNTGDTTWLAAEDRVAGGYVSLGGHLHEQAGGALKVGYITRRLPHDVAPAETVAVRLPVALPERAGRFTLRLDLVDDRIAWFSQLGSPTVDVELVVSWPPSDDPHRFGATIEMVGPFPPRAREDFIDLHLRVTNTGDTTWLAGRPAARGTVQVGLQLLDADGSVRELDYSRIPLSHTVAPGETVEIRASVPLRSRAHRHFALDLVAEQICWFAEHGSRTLRCTLAG